MADKQYAQTIQRALDDEIAALVAQQTPVLYRRRSPVSPVPPASEVAGDGSSFDQEEAYQDSPAPPPTPVWRGQAPPAQAAPGGPPAEKERKEAYGSASDAALPPPAPARAVAPPPAYAAAPAPLPTPQTTLANLDQRIGRLMQVRDWIQEDGDIARLLDTVIGKQVQSSERRQARLAVALNIIFLVAGWALALVASPDTLRHLFGR